MQGDEDNPYKSQKWIEDMSNGLSHELEALTLGGIQIEEVQKGLIRCKFLIPKYLSVTISFQLLYFEFLFLINMTLI